MMKTILLILFALIVSICSSQDTLQRIKRYDNSVTYYIAHQGDTFFIDVYPNGNTEAIRSTCQHKDSVWEYERFYPNGKKMWVKEMKGWTENGKALFYNDNGIKVGEFQYREGSITDTLYIHPKYKLLLGKATYYSVVYGGMQREDGSSNISGGEGIYMFYHMYAVKLDSTSKQQKIYKQFSTDYNANFFLCVEKGLYGFFPQYYKITDVSSGMGTPPPMVGSSWENGWNNSEPLNTKYGSLFFVHLHFHSVGYAP